MYIKILNVTLYIIFICQLFLTWRKLLNEILHTETLIQEKIISSPIDSLIKRQHIISQKLKLDLFKIKIYTE